MIQKGREFDEIFDLVAIRVIVDSVKDCYAALGCIHGRWKPVLGSVQGLHRDAEVQPLPELAHDGHRARRQGRSRCRSAPARCTSAPSGASPPTGRTRTTRQRSDIDWLNRIIDWQADITDPAQFMENLKTDLEQDEVFVFTPKGRVITLPVGATPSTSPTRCTPRSVTLHRRQGQRPAGAARPARCAAATRARSSPRRSRRPARRATGCSSSPRRGRATRSASGSRRERRVDMIEAGARS